MNDKNNDSVTSLRSCVCCPDCRGDLRVIGSDQVHGLFCPDCQIAFPAADGIFILLDSGCRNDELEAPLVRELARHAVGNDEQKACDRTLRLLGDDQGESYVWEDEKHWTHEYGGQLQSGNPKNWNDRYWQRTPLFQVAIDRLRHNSASERRVVIDIGCGEGQDFRKFLAGQLGENDVYVGIDISLSGLLLNRRHNPHVNSIYILGSADKPPLRTRIADVVICLGTLHHMQTKEKGLPIVAELVSKGVILLSEPINGRFLPDRMRIFHGSRSAHDDFIDYAGLRRSIDNLKLGVVYERQLSGLVYFLLMKLFRPLLLRSRKLHGFAHSLDEFLFTYLKGIFPILRPRGLLMALSKEANA
jgi:uncharacterized protein YbaR (Trm112 family)/SAM-dependent methyltransferase